VLLGASCSSSDVIGREASDASEGDVAAATTVPPSTATSTTISPSERAAHLAAQACDYYTPGVEFMAERFKREADDPAYAAENSKDVTARDLAASAAALDQRWRPLFEAYAECVRLSGEVLGRQANDPLVDAWSSSSTAVQDECRIATAAR
jgi:hypothetical protein